MANGFNKEKNMIGEKSHKMKYNMELENLNSNSVPEEEKLSFVGRKQ